MSKELCSACSPGATCSNVAASICPMAVQRHLHSVRMYGAIASAGAAPLRALVQCHCGRLGTALAGARCLHGRAVYGLGTHVRFFFESVCVWL